MAVNPNRPGWRYMRRNHGESAPQTWVYLDTIGVDAPDPSKPNRYLRSLAYGSAQYVRWDNDKPTRMSRCFFSDPQQFWAWLAGLTNNRRSLWICGHGVAQSMTLLHFWDLVDAGVYELRRRAPTIQHGDTQTEKITYTEDYLFLTKDPPTIIMARAGEALIHIVDTRNYLDADLVELAAWCKSPIVPEPARTDAPIRWEAHMRSRVKALTAAMGKLRNWWTKNQMGVWRYTASSLAMAHFRHAHYRQPIVLDDHQDSRDLCRAALAGGECRCFWIGETLPWLEHNAKQQQHRKRGKVRTREGPVFHYDCNSLYPYVMRENLFPRELVAWQAPGSFDDLKAWRDKLCLVARVTLNSWEIPYPVSVDGERWFACGQFTTSLAGPELYDAYDRGFIKHVHEIAAYMPGRLFTTYVDALYPQKLAAKNAGDDITYQLVKSLLNNLAGKFSQRDGGWSWSDMPCWGERWGPIARTVNGDAVSRRYRAIAGYVQQQDELTDSLESLPAVTAFVNSYARMYMRSVRYKIGHANIIYQDTDSLHVSVDGSNAMHKYGFVDDDQLGLFGLVRTVERGHYRGVKNYTEDGRHVVGGRKSLCQVISYDKWVQEECESLESIIGRQPQGIIRVERVAKSLSRLNPRGCLHADGTVTPARVLNKKVHLKATYRDAGT